MNKRLPTLKFLILFLASLGLVGEASARCTIRVADPLITHRYQSCNRRTFLSYLYNDLVTPFSFTCAKKLSETCRTEHCGSPKTEDEARRCTDQYVAVLDECRSQIADAALMARCTDTLAWTLPTKHSATIASARVHVGAKAPIVMQAPPSTPVVSAPPAEVSGPPAPDEIPVFVEPLPPNYAEPDSHTVRTSQSSLRPL